MLDIGWQEMLIVGGLLLIVIGPKDLPKVLRTVGLWTGKARKMAREFQKALDEYAKDAELDGVKKAVETPMKAKKAMASALDPTGTLKKELTAVDSDLRKNLSDSADAVRAKDDGASIDPTTPERPAVATPTTSTGSKTALAKKPKVEAGGTS